MPSTPSEATLNNLRHKSIDAELIVRVLALKYIYTPDDDQLACPLALLNHWHLNNNSAPVAAQFSACAKTLETTPASPYL
jgi:hypothetical protein